MLTYFIWLASAFIFIALVAAGLLFQKRSVFSPRYHRDDPLLHGYPSQLHALELLTDQNVRLEGIVYEPEYEALATILYFGGREQDSVGMIYKLAHVMPEVRWVTFNYRGYGKSGDKPSETKLLADALRICDMLQERYGKISVMGFSLGASIAAYAASRRAVEKLFLVAAFDSIASMARDRYHFIIRFLIRYRFDTAKHVRFVKAPTYLFGSIDDKIIPISHTRLLLLHVKNLAEYHEYLGYDHNKLLLSEGVVKTIKKAIQT